MHSPQRNPNQSTPLVKFTLGGSGSANNVQTMQQQPQEQLRQSNTAFSNYERNQQLLHRQFVLRAEGQISHQLRHMIKENNFQDVQLRFKDQRNGELQLGNDVHTVKLVDLPAIIEAYKTLDGLTYYKSGDVAQMLYVREGANADMRDIANESDSGITSTTKNIRRYWEKRQLHASPDNLLELEDELTRIFEEENPDNVSIEIISEDEDEEAMHMEQERLQKEQERRDRELRLKQREMESGLVSEPQEGDVSMENAAAAEPETHEDELEDDDESSPFDESIPTPVSNEAPTPFEGGLKLKIKLPVPKPQAATPSTATPTSAVTATLPSTAMDMETESTAFTPQTTDFATTTGLPPASESNMSADYLQQDESNLSLEEYSDRESTSPRVAIRTAANTFHEASSASPTQASEMDESSDEMEDLEAALAAVTERVEADTSQDFASPLSSPLSVQSPASSIAAAEIGADEQLESNLMFEKELQLRLEQEERERKQQREAEINGITQNLYEIDESLRSARKRKTDADEELHGIEQRINDNKERLAGGLNPRMKERFMKQIADLEAQLAAKRENVQKEDDTVEMLMQQQNELQERLHHLRQQ